VPPHHWCHIVLAKSDSKHHRKRVAATGYTTPFMRGVFTTPDGLTEPGSNRGIESSLGDLVADSLRETILTPDGKSVDIGMINAGGLREDLVPNEDGTHTALLFFKPRASRSSKEFYADARYGDFWIADERDLVYAVAEDHSGEGEPVNSI